MKRSHRLGSAFRAKILPGAVCKALLTCNSGELVLPRHRYHPMGLTEMAVPRSRPLRPKTLLKTSRPVG